MVSRHEQGVIPFESSPLRFLRQKVYEHGEALLPGLCGNLEGLDALIMGDRELPLDFTKHGIATVSDVARLLVHQNSLLFGGLKEQRADFPFAKKELDALAGTVRPLFDPSSWNGNFFLPPYLDHERWKERIGDPVTSMDDNARALFALYAARLVPNNTAHANRLRGSMRRAESNLAQQYDGWITVSDVWRSIVDTHLPTVGNAK